MEINVGMDGDIVMLDLNGDLVASTAEDLKAQVAKLVEKNFRYIMLDLSKVGFMDSSGLGSCMAVHKTLNEKQGLLVCAQPSEAVAKIFRITRADQKIKVMPTRSDASKNIFDRIVQDRKQK